MVFTLRILWSESDADHLFYPSLNRALNYILWDDCASVLLANDLLNYEKSALKTQLTVFIDTMAGWLSRKQSRLAHVRLAG